MYLKKQPGEPFTMLRKTRRKKKGSFSLSHLDKLGQHITLFCTV